MRSAGQLTVYQPRVIARSAARAPVGPRRFKTDERAQVRPPDLPSVGGSAGGGIDLGRDGGGIGVGIGGGGRLRIGRRAATVRDDL
jgi:hypothetical protein